MTFGSQHGLGRVDGSREDGSAALTQPFLHDTVTCVRAPSTLLSGPDGQVRAGGVHGWFRHDVRRLSQLLVVLGRPGDSAAVHEPEPIGAALDGADGAMFAAVSRLHGEAVSDPTVYVERRRRLDVDRLVEELRLTNHGRVDQQVAVRIEVAADHAPVPLVKLGADVPDVVDLGAATDGCRWWSPAGATELVCAPPPDAAVPAGAGAALLEWSVALPAGGSWAVELVVTATDTEPPVLRGAAVPVTFEATSASSSVGRLVGRGVADLAALLAAFEEYPEDAFATAGSPWYLTLFGRDSLWSARLALPLGQRLAGGTLRVLASRQGSRHDPATAEQPGKILHELRYGPGVAGHWLPPLYFGTVDATMLWVSLLHDAWRWGLPPDEVRALLPHLHRALDWLLDDADADGDDLVEYRDESGSGLSNQGWKDSADAVPHADGALARAPLALCEVQAYQVRALLDADALLTALDPGAGRAAELPAQVDRVRAAFRRSYWVDDSAGAYPAIALDGEKVPVASATSNIGHLLASGLLDPTEEALVAARLGRPDLDAGLGLRTLSAQHPRFNPVGYHTGSIWPHDTAIAVLGLARSGHSRVAASLAAGVVSASDHFDGRLPELYGGPLGGAPVAAYPASCRPQSWSAAAAVAFLQAALGLEADVPNGTLTVAPRAAFRAWFPLSLRGVQVGDRRVDIEVDADGAARVQGADDLAVAVADLA